jgi:hypothetical protein
MSCRAMSCLLIGVWWACAVGANARSGRGASSAVDATRDARLGARVRLRAEAIPLRRVCRALAEVTGVRMDVAGSAGDERLVAFVPDASLADVMLAVADLYRLSWVRGGSAERPSYQLLKPPAMAQEEQALRDRSFRQLLAHLEEEFRTRQRPAAERPEKQPDAWAPVYPFVLPLITANSSDFLREGYLYLTVASLPAEQRQPLVRALQPIIDAQHAAMQGFEREAHERLRAEGKPDLKFGGEDSPPPPAEASTVTVEMGVREELSASVGLKTGAGIWHGWVLVSSDDLQAPGMDLYKDRRPKLPAAADEVPEPAPEPETDLLARRVEVPAAKPPRPGDWIGALGRLSDAASVPIYADSYPNYLQGITWHPRSDFDVAGKVSVARALNRLCYPLANRGAQKLGVNSFWWRRGDAALIRSRRWLWESAAVLPTDLLDRLTASVRATGQIAPGDLPAIASLTALQVQSIGFLDGGRETWRRAVQLPSRLGQESRKLLLTSGLTGEKMPPADRALLARLLPLPPGGSLARYTARLKTTVGSFPAQGGTVVGLQFEAADDAGTAQSFLYLPLPGVGAGPGLPPQGLVVTEAGRGAPP